MIDRRLLLRSGLAALAGAGGLLGAASATPSKASESAGTAKPDTGPAESSGTYAPVSTPGGATLPWTRDGAVKVFHLVAQPLRRELAPGLVANCWGYNGQTPGPTIEAVEGDRVRILVSNQLPEPTAMHWHGLLLPNALDGMAGLNQPAIAPGETYAYEFTLRQHGTQMYHPHVDEMTQVALGMMGFFVIHPRQPSHLRVERDFCIFLHQWAIAPGAATPDPTVMSDFNVFTFNGRAYPATEPLVVRRGQRVRLRLANLSMDSHPIHVHGVRFEVTGTDGGTVPEAARYPETTVNVPPGTTRDIEFVAAEAGDWPVHCHKTHHTMNQMGHNLPIVVGADTAGVQDRIQALVPGTMLMGQTGMAAPMQMSAPSNSIPMQGGKGPYGPIDMGGMFTVLKVRDGIASYEDPGWYPQPAGSGPRKVEP